MNDDTSDKTDATPAAPGSPVRQPAPKPERIAKMMARAGAGSRRAVERMIEAGMVRLHGKPVTNPATLVASVEGITVDGEPLKPIEPPKLWRYHKPRGLITSYHDPEGRRTVFEALPPEIPRVMAVGRLDFNTEGLLLLTNDGGLARFLELPATGWLRRYRVRAFGHADLKFIETIRSGVTIEGVSYGPVEIEIEKEQGDNIWLQVGIREGKNREVRKILEHFGLTVNRLIRVAYGPFHLGKLPRGGVERVPDRVMEAQLENYLRLSGQSLPRNEAAVARPKAANPRGRAGWAKASAKDEVKPRRRVRLDRMARGKTDPESAVNEGAAAIETKPGAKTGLSRRPLRPLRAAGPRALAGEAEAKRGAQEHRQGKPSGVMPKANPRRRSKPLSARPKG